MGEEARKILEKWNNGVYRGAQRRLARELGLEENTISQCLTGKQNPSERMITGMSKIFGKSKEEIKRIFCAEKEKPAYTQNNIRSKGSFHQVINEYKSEALSAQMRALEAKIDLLIQLVKEGK